MQHDQEAKDFVQNATVISDILHPLTELSPTGWVDCRDSPYVHHNSQPILLRDSIYTKGMSDGKGTAWKFYIPTKSWSPIPSPPGISADDYALAIYRSQLVWIGGRVHTGNKTESNKKIFVYEQGNGWKEDTNLIPSIPDDVSLYWRLFASGDDKYLIAAQESKLLVFDGEQWQLKDGPERDIRSVLVHHSTLYLISQGCSFYKASMQSLLAGNDSDWEMLKLSYYAYALTLVGDHIAMVASDDTISRTLCVLGYCSASNSWIGLTQLNLNHSNIVSVVGQPNGTLLLMGLIRVMDPSLPQNPSATVLRQFSMLPVLQFGMIEVAPNVLPYNPEGKLSVAAVVKLDLHAGFHVLAKLSANLDSFKEKAGFSISQNKPLLMPDLYKESSAVKCIQSWVDDEMPSLPPTWKNFLQILRELELSDVFADEIDHYLKSTAQKQQQQEQKQETTGLEDIALLRFKLESLHKKVINIQEEEIQELVKFCFETCRLGFDKVGKQVQTYEQKVKQLEEERDHLLKECQYLKDIDEQGQLPAKCQRVESDRKDRPGALSITDLRDIQRAAWDSRDEWYNIGLELKIDPGTLDVIKRDNTKTNDCFREMLTTWLKVVQPEPTLSALAEALQSPTVGFGDLAEQVLKLNDYFDSKKNL